MSNAAERRVSFVLAVLTLTVSACAGSNLSDPGTSDPAVQVALARDVYQAGDTVVAMIRNVGGVTLEYSYAFCQSVLQRQHQGGDWSTVSPPPVGCALNLAFLRPNNSVPLTFRLPSNLPAGIYRPALPQPAALGENASTALTVTTPAFSVNAVTLQ